MLLAIDTATRALSLALHDGLRLRVEMTWHTSNQHTVELAPAIQHLLNMAAMDVGALSSVAVASGPGSFNGLRIGVSTAKGLAMARGLPLRGVPTLDITAAGMGAPEAPEMRLVAVAEAGRGRVCAETYTWHGGLWRGAGDARIVGWAALAEGLAGARAALIAGEIDDAGRDVLGGAGLAVRLVPRRAGVLAEIAARYPAGDAAALTPHYLHQPGVPQP
jgi:tRNA threonylcarbamoyladenosine biosynthesis protein TsaB